MPMLLPSELCVLRPPPIAQAEQVKKIGRGSSGDVFLLRVVRGNAAGRLVVSKRCAFDDEMSDEQTYEMYHEVS